MYSVFSLVSYEKHSIPLSTSLITCFTASFACSHLVYRKQAPGPAITQARPCSALIGRPFAFPQRLRPSHSVIPTTPSSHSNEMDIRPSAHHQAPLSTSPTALEQSPARAPSISTFTLDSNQPFTPPYTKPYGIPTLHSTDLILHLYEFSLDTPFCTLTRWEECSI